MYVSAFVSVVCREKREDGFVKKKKKKEKRKKKKRLGWWSSVRHC